MFSISLKRSQWYPKERLLKIQEKKLESMIHHAYNNVPFYHEYYKFLGGNLSINHLPMVTKQILRSTPFEKRVTPDGLKNLRKWDSMYTSGSSGEPLRILKSPRELAMGESYNIRTLFAQGAKFTDRVCQIRPVKVGASHQIQRFVEKGSLYGIIRRVKARPILLSSNISDSVEFLKKWRPQVFISPPSFLIALTDFCRANELKLMFRIIQTRGELLSEQARRKIADFFQAEVFDEYGAAEVGGIAWECSTHEGYHVNAENVYVEVLRNGFPVEAGEIGEICVTSLYRYTTPFIRYLLGDFVKFVDGECSCGRKLPLLGSILGRTVEIVWRRDGMPVFPLTILHSLHDIDGLKKFKIVQRSDYSVEVYADIDDSSPQDVVSELETRCRLLFPETPFSIKIGQIHEEYSAKFRPIVSYVVNH